MQSTYLTPDGQQINAALNHTGAGAATALGASVGALESNYFGANLAAFMLAIFFIGVLSFGFSAGEGRLSICQCHPDDHCFDSAGKSRVDRCPASIH
jgi:hypothetical protein